MGQTQKQRLHSTNNLKIITDVTLKNRAKNHPVSRKGKQRVGKMNKNQITMAITNLNNTHLTAAQVTAATTAITALETELAAVNVNLSAEDRQRYGSINEQNKLLVNKTMDYHNTQPALQTPHVDWTEYAKDFTSRNNLEGMIARLESLIVRLNNAKILHDYDNYQAALADYSYANFMAGTATPGYETKVNDMKQFFSRVTASKTATEE